LPEAKMDERKTRLKTIRLPESLVRSLEREAADEGTSVNADVNSIISRHFKWHKRLREYGFVTIAKPAFTSMVEGLDDETLARIGREAVPPLYKEMAELWFQDSAPEKILDAINLRFKFDPLMRAEIAKEGNEYTMVFRHDLGPKWSILVESASREIVKRFFHTEPRISRGKSVVTARFKVNPRNLPI
jgi:hypothetical protein